LRTLLFCTAWADNAEALDRRVGRWVRHHASIPWPCDVRLAVAADGIDPDVPWPAGDYERLNHVPHLGRPDHLSYPGWWRSFTSGLTLACNVGAVRMWHVESDFFVASERMVDRLHAATRGWTAFWCERWGFAETAVQAICCDRYRDLQDLKTRLEVGGYRTFDGQHAEHVLPFDQVERGMVGDRYGEAGVDPRSIPGLDYYGQLGPEFDPLFARKGESDGRTVVLSDMDVDRDPASDRGPETMGSVAVA
jgi:hypothetical protein